MKWQAFWAKRLPWQLIAGKRFKVPANLNIWYVFGALLLLALTLQLLTGLWLTMFYLPSAELAFASIQNLSRQVSYGWLLRSLHTTGASAIFVLVYLHLLRGFWYRSYDHAREVVWLLGVVLFWLLLAEAFLGYLLPWGQMSYWGATVITSMLTALPWGDALVVWLRGDYTVSGVTLQRFFALHIIAVPLLLGWVIRLHIKALHHVGSGHPAELQAKKIVPRQVPFYPQQFRKDLLACLIYLIIFCAVVFFVPKGWGVLMDALNERPADPWQTPADIKPLWYMAPYYALLRAIPSKIGGIGAVVFSLLSLAFIPWLSQAVRGWRVKPAATQPWRWLCLALAVASWLGLIVLGLLPLQSWLSVVTLGFVIIGILALLLAL